MIDAHSYAAFDPKSPLQSWDFQRREVGDDDVQIDILFCGVCHSDLHYARSEWMPVTYPQVVGHEIVGKVVKTGKNVTKHKVGDLVGVGCIVDSCRHCASCHADLENYCTEGMQGTYMGVEKQTGRQTQGGYSTVIVVDEHYVLRIPAGMDPAQTAPLLCAGITLYSPLRHWNAGPGKTVGIVGLGGLGHMGVKLAHAMGAKVILFTTSPDKVADGKKLGADDVIISRNKEEMARYKGKLDLIVNTVSVAHDLDPYINLLKLDGTMVLVGAPATPHPSPQVFNLLMQRRSLAGSGIGGIKETQEMLDFCAKHGVMPEIEMTSMQDINQAWDRVVGGDVRYRFVIDMATLKSEQKAA
ncbi:MAG: NAD(P)-dependent alcohol dehydrogenase [Verrucomicrobiota bacterium]|nr:NAD(P)-dependent alcohol dehydrogenase [Verrucomicrobiota bacterium]